MLLALLLDCGPEVGPPPADSADDLGLALRAAAETSGWTVADGPRLFAGAEIYDYMDGAGEIPLACGFVRLGQEELRHDAGARVTVEIYDMGESASAFGLASLRRDPESRTLETTAHPASLSAGRLVLWKGRLTAVLSAEDASRLPDGALVGLGRAIEAAVTEPGEPPDLLRRLPREGYVERSARFFRGKFALDTLWFRAENVFALDVRTEAALARYREPGATLLVVRYPDGDAARRALEVARVALGARDGVSLPGGGEAFAGETESGPAGLLLRGEILGAVLAAPDPPSVLRRLADLDRALGDPGEPLER